MPYAVVIRRRHTAPYYDTTKTPHTTFYPTVSRSVPSVDAYVEMYHGVGSTYLLVQMYFLDKKYVLVHPT